MDDQKKTNEQLITELVGLRKRMSALEAEQTEREAIETELSGARARPRRQCVITANIRDGVFPAE